MLFSKLFPQSLSKTSQPTASIVLAQDATLTSWVDNMLLYLLSVAFSSSISDKAYSNWFINSLNSYKQVSWQVCNLSLNIYSNISFAYILACLSSILNVFFIVFIVYSRAFFSLNAFSVFCFCLSISTFIFYSLTCYAIDISYAFMFLISIQSSAYNSYSSTLFWGTYVTNKTGYLTRFFIGEPPK